MLVPTVKHFRKYLGRLSRRELFRTGGLLATGGLLGSDAVAAPQTAAVPDIYRSLGVRPVVNARGVITVIGGSLVLPEVKAAMDQASRCFVQLDELVEAVGKRLAALTGAEWGIVTTGAAGSLTVAACACIAGADPDKLEMLANGLPYPGMRNEIIIPRSSRNAYDHSIRALGVKIVEPENFEQLQQSFGPHTAMVMLLSAAPDYDEGPMAVEKVTDVARRHKIPVLTDAAAEILQVPNAHFQRGVDLLAYSGGKCLRGPQCCGLLLGRKDLVQGAWVVSAPHHTVCRSLKVGKEEIVGVLTAVEIWMKRDHAAEERTWLTWLEQIAARLKPIDGITTTIQPPQGINNRTPKLNIHWDRERIDLSEDEFDEILWTGEPRVAINGKGSFLPFPPDEGSTATIIPYMMLPGDQKIVAEQLYRVLSNAPKPGSRKKPAPAAADLSGHWNVHIEFVLGSADHSFTLQQQGNDLTGAHQGLAATRQLRGTAEGNDVLMRTWYAEHGARLNYTFRGKARGNRMEGSLLVGELGAGRWSAERRA